MPLASTPEAQNCINYFASWGFFRVLARLILWAIKIMPFDIRSLFVSQTRLGGSCDRKSWSEVAFAELPRSEQGLPTQQVDLSGRS